MTPQEKAAELQADPAFDFAADPVRAIQHASTRASQAERSGNQTRAGFWTKTGLALCAAAGREPGLLLTRLSEEIR